MNVGEDPVTGRKRSIASGRYMGRFVYTPVSPVGSQRELGEPTVYNVNRVGDDQYLGQVSNLPPSQWWHSCGPGDTRWNPLRHRRREWAADELDARSLMDQWCQCGLAVGEHDRPTRIACRTWAQWEGDGRLSGEASQAARKFDTIRAAQHVRPHRGHYDIRSAVAHAQLHANRLDPGHVMLVVPGIAPAHQVLLSPAVEGSGTMVRHFALGQYGEVYAYPDQAEGVQAIVELYLGRGYAACYDWRR